MSSFIVFWQPRHWNHWVNDSRISLYSIFDKAASIRRKAALNMKLLVIFSITVAILATSHAGEKKILIDIYVEYSCPYSKEFITNQLAPAYNGIKDDFDLNFYTMGKSTSFENENGEVEFRCQHGPRECEGNKLQTCGLNQIGKKNQDKQTDFMVCTMGIERTFEECCEYLGLDFSDIEACKTSRKGTELQLEVEKATAPALKKHEHVPLVIFDSKFDENELSASLLDFKGLCLRKLSANW